MTVEEKGKDIEMVDMKGDDKPNENEAEEMAIEVSTIPNNVSEAYP